MQWSSYFALPIASFLHDPTQFLQGSDNIHLLECHDLKKL